MKIAYLQVCASISFGSDKYVQYFDLRNRCIIDCLLIQPGSLVRYFAVARCVVLWFQTTI
jgi:hypothetical protein